MVATTSWLALIQYLLAGSVDYAYGGLFASVGFVAAIVGINVIGYIVRRYNARSLIIAVIAVILVVSTLLMTLVGVLNVERALRTNDEVALSFKAPC